ncbi:ACT domain-containing protein [Candidatus Saccharibacteria bacterium]|nr:ACT domain-containing protein [Candidatus Saccharibacteria bacterium]MDQ5885236.1 Acetolactate synthase small subunit [Patescibacteria group bacterium]
MTKHTDYTFTLEARDVPGMLVRITQVFARRGCNIQSLNVRPQKVGQWSVIDIDARDVERPEQVEAQLQKLIDINSVIISKKLSSL